MSRKSKITKQLIDEAYKLSKGGFSHKQIYNSLGISHTLFYANIELVETIKKAERELRIEVSNTLLENAVNGDTTSMIFLAKRLNLFSSDINIELKDSRSALVALNEIINANIPLEQKNSLKSVVETFLKAYETTELEKRIESLEKNNQN